MSCHALAGMAMSNVVDLSNMVKTKIEPRSPLIIKSGLRVLVPSEDLASSTGIIEITQGAKTESIPEINETSKNAIR